MKQQMKRQFKEAIDWEAARVHIENAYDILKNKIEQEFIRRYEIIRGLKLK